MIIPPPGELRKLRLDSAKQAASMTHEEIMEQIKKNSTIRSRCDWLPDNYAALEYGVTDKELEAFEKRIKREIKEEASETPIEIDYSDKGWLKKLINS